MNNETPRKFNPSPAYLEYRREVNKKRLNILGRSSLVNDLKAYGEKQGVEWSIETGRSIFTPINN
jgi:hypothetical protein